MYVSAVINSPFGVTAFGSTILRAEPDYASIRFKVNCTEKQPRAAFTATRKTAAAVREFLTKAAVEDVSASRISLNQAFKYSGGENRFVGYTASVGFHVILKKLDALEDVLAGCVDAGVDQLDEVRFQTTRLKELRAEARTKAVQAAKEKALIYARAAGITLGKVLHIEDVNPDNLAGRSESNVDGAGVTDDSGSATAFDPGSIAVNGAVIVAFAIQ